MSKPTSSISTAISIRIPNDLLQSVVDYALAQGFINESGRTDKRGQPNLSAAITGLLRQALAASDPNIPEPEYLSDSVVNKDGTGTESITAMEDRLIAKLCTAITQHLDNLLVNHHPLNLSGDLSSLRPVTQAITDADIEPPVIEKEDTRQRLLNAVSRGFRSRGYSGIGIDALVKEAGVTSGAFYGYFRSKEEAFLAAVVTGLEEYRANVDAFQTNQAENWIIALADYYMSRQHRDNLACGCALATLSPEVIRSSQRVRLAYQTELVKLNAAIASGLPAETEQQAWVLLALLAGGVTLARAVWDEDLSDRIAGGIRQATIAIASGKLENG